MVSPLHVNASPSSHRSLEISSKSSPIPILWGASDPLVRGPVVTPNTGSQNTGRNQDIDQHNAIGTHRVDTAIYQALTMAQGHQPHSQGPKSQTDISGVKPISAGLMTSGLNRPNIEIGPYATWFNEHKIVSMDPFGTWNAQMYQSITGTALGIRPTIAIATTQLQMPELQNAVVQGWLEEDGAILQADGTVTASKAVISPVWYLPGIADRLQIQEKSLRQSLFQQTGGMFPELVTRPELSLFLPPVGDMSVYIVGDLAAAIRQSHRSIAVRIHDECHSSDVFGANRYTCRAKLVHALETAIETAQAGGAGVIVYQHQGYGQAWGTQTPAAQPQILMPDVLHWLGINQINTLLTSNVLKYEAIVKAGIQVIDQLPVPPDWFPHMAER